MNTRPTILGACLVVAVLGLQADSTEPPAKKPLDTDAKPTSEAESAEPFHKELLQIAREYKKYGRVDDETRWAPYLCRMPMPSQARFSGSDEADTHGQKLYFLFAKDRSAYLLGDEKKPTAAGQVLVKQSWQPVELKADEQPLRFKWQDIKRDKPFPKEELKEDVSLAFGGSYFPYAKKDGKLYHAEKQTGLFIMFKTDPKTPGTDEGWVYGTVSSDGKKVTAAGRVQSCMDCHREAPHDRLFGIPRDRPFGFSAFRTESKPDEKK